MRTVHQSIYVVQQIMSKRWISEILMSINTKNHRYSEIFFNIPDISSRELRRKLKLLCEYGLIVNEEGKQGYYLTQLGEDIIDVVLRVSRLAKKLLQAKRR
jgi:DNA-binding HxlR family transcriptional regulator